MGIDAEILIKYRGSRPTDIELNKWSWNLCNAIGANHFYVSDGLQPEQYQEKEKLWRSAFDNHPLQREYKKSKDRGALYNKIISDIGKRPVCLQRAIEFTNRIYPLDDEFGIPPEYRAYGKAYLQDKSMLASPDEYFLNVSLTSRYYGIGYERGDLLAICAIAEWIEQNMQPCEVWYGGDSGVGVKLFDEKARKVLRAHLFGCHGKDYFSYDKPGSLRTPKPCGLCIPGENRFNRYGWSAQYSAAHCGGCGKSWESNDAGESWTIVDEKE